MGSTCVYHQFQPERYIKIREEKRIPVQKCRIQSTTVVLPSIVNPCPAMDRFGMGPTQESWARDPCWACNWHWFSILHKLLVNLRNEEGLPRSNLSSYVQSVSCFCHFKRRNLPLSHIWRHSVILLLRNRESTEGYSIYLRERWVTLRTHSGNPLFKPQRLVSQSKCVLEEQNKWPWWNQNIKSVAKFWETWCTELKSSR